MATLRLAFLSSLVLELLATVSVALVAVAVGLRLLGGHLPFHDALFVLVLAPEAYLPLRTLGADYHASADGMQAAEEIFDCSKSRTPAVRGRRARPPTPAVRRSDGLEVTPIRGGGVPAVHGMTSTSPRRDRGAGRAQRLRQVEPVACVLGLRRPEAGSVRVGGVDLAEVDLDAWRRRIAWVPQRPHLFAAQLADNIRLGRPDATDAEVAAALEAAGLTAVVRPPARRARHPAGRGRGRAVHRRAPAGGPGPRLPARRAAPPAGRADGQPGHETEAAVLGAVRTWSAGRTALMVAHRPALAALADRVVELRPPAPVPGRVRATGAAARGDRPAGTAAHPGRGPSGRRRLAGASLLGAGAIGATSP